MQFSKVIGKIDPELVKRAEQRLTQVFVELACSYDNAFPGSHLGGDPFIFALMYPVQHVATLNIPTAATDGIRFYWNPKFILKLNKIGLRLVCAHEAWHAIYMHPARRGSRIPKLWNIAVDYIVNGMIFDDLAVRYRSKPHVVVADVFTKNLGRFMTLNDYCELLKDPFAKIKGFEDLNPRDSVSGPSVDLPAPGEDRELTVQERKELEKRERKTKFFYADPDLSADMKSPEKIYNLLYSLLPKCPKCGKVGKYLPPSQPGDQPSNDSGGTQSKDGCDVCGKGIDVFELGGTVDDHVDSEETPENMAKRLSDAAQTARQMAGHIPAGVAEELGQLSAPRITWKDFIRSRLYRARSGRGRNDWTRFRTRPMFAGMMVPKQRHFFAHFGCLIDTSGSMDKNEKALGMSQLAALDEQSEGTIVPADAQIYWESATKLRRATYDELSKVKLVGGGGTRYAEFFSQYEKKIGKCDFLVIITDGILSDVDIANMQNPGIDVIWLLTASTTFKPPFGRAFDLHAL